MKFRIAKSTAVMALALAMVFFMTGLFHLSQDLDWGIKVEAEEPDPSTSNATTESKTEPPTEPPTASSADKTEKPPTGSSPNESSKPTTASTKDPGSTTAGSQDPPQPTQALYTPPSASIGTNGDGVESVLTFVVRIYNKDSDTYEEKVYSFKGKAGSDYVLTNPGIDGYTTYGLPQELLQGELKPGTTTINVAVIANDHANKDSIVSGLIQSQFLNSNGNSMIATVAPTEPEPSKTDPSETPTPTESKPTETPSKTDPESSDPTEPEDSPFHEISGGDITIDETEAPEDAGKGKIVFRVHVVDKNGKVWEKTITKFGKIGGTFKLSSPTGKGYRFVAGPDTEKVYEIKEGTQTFNVSLADEKTELEEKEVMAALTKAGAVDENGKAIESYDDTPVEEEPDETEPTETKPDETDPDATDPDKTDPDETKPEETTKDDEDPDDEDEDPDDDDEPDETDPTRPKPVDPEHRLPDWWSNDWRPTHDVTPTRYERRPQVNYPRYQWPSGGWVVRQPAQQQTQQPVDPTQPPVQVTQPTFDKAGKKDVEAVDKDRVEWPDRTTAETSVKQLKTLPEPERQAASLPAKIFFAIVGGGVVLMGIGIGVWQILKKR